MLVRLFITLFFCTGSIVQAQVHWRAVTSRFGELPPGIQIYYTADSLHGRPFRAFFAEVDLRERNLAISTEVGNGKRYTPAEYYTRTDSALLIVNCTYFSFETNQNLGTVIQQGKQLAYNVPALKSRTSDSFYYPTRAALGISKRRKADIAWLFTDTAKRWPYAFQQNPVLAKGLTSDPGIEDLNTLEYWSWWKKETAVGGGPVLIHAGKIRITNIEEQVFVNGQQDLHPRTAMGYTRKGKLIILVIQGRDRGVAEGASLLETAQLLKQLRCQEALNLDGGGSSTLLVNGIETIKPSDKTGQRPVPAVFVVRKNAKNSAGN